MHRERREVSGDLVQIGTGIRSHRCSILVPEVHVDSAMKGQQRRSHSLHTSAAEHESAGGPNVSGGLDQKPSLAHAGLAHQEHSCACTRGDFLPDVVEHLQLSDTTNEGELFVNQDPNSSRGRDGSLRPIEGPAPNRPEPFELDVTAID